MKNCMSGKRIYRHRKAVPELTNKRDERIDELVNSCVVSLDKIKRNECRAKPWEGAEA